MVKIYYFIDKEYVTFQEFYSTLLFECPTPYVLEVSLHELNIYNQVFVGRHYFKIKKIYKGGLS